MSYDSIYEQCPGICWSMVQSRTLLPFILGYWVPFCVVLLRISRLNPYTWDGVKTPIHNPFFLQIQLFWEIVPYHRIVWLGTFKGHLVHISKEHSKPQMSCLPSNDPALDWSRGSSLQSPLYWGLGCFQSGTPCAGTFSHQEPQVTFLPSSYSKAGGFGCQISVSGRKECFVEGIYLLVD